MTGGSDNDKLIHYNQNGEWVVTPYFTGKRFHHVAYNLNDINTDSLSVPDTLGMLIPGRETQGFTVICDNVVKRYILGGKSGVEVKGLPDWPDDISGSPGSLWNDYIVVLTSRTLAKEVKKMQILISGLSGQCLAVCHTATNKL